MSDQLQFQLKSLNCGNSCICIWHLKLPQLIGCVVEIPCDKGD